METWDENIKWISEYRFPLQHKGKDYREVLSEWLSEYVEKVQDCSILQRSDIGKIKDFSMGLLECYDLYLNTKFLEAYSKFNCLMDSVKDFLLCIDIGKRRYDCDIMDSYYRIRLYEKSYSYQQMLHIPLKERHIASTNRFSAPGMPCSYLASETTLCWYECGMPVTFQVAKYDVDLDNAKEKKLLQLDINPLQIVKILRHSCLNHDLDYATSVCYTLPLVAACSVVVENKSAKFIKEYILPQMLMVWIKSETDIAGIRYNSDVENELARNWNAYNIAIPVRNDCADGYCGYLTSIFRNDMNQKSQTINIKKRIIDSTDQIEQIIKFYYKVNQTRQLHKTNNLEKDIDDVDLLKKLTDFTLNLLVILEQLKKENTNLTYATALTVSNLWTWGELIKDSSGSVSPEIDIMYREFIDIVLRFSKKLSRILDYIQEGED